MTFKTQPTFVYSLICLFAFVASLSAQSSEQGSGKKADDHKFSVADGKFNFSAPGSWKKIKPKFDFYQAEFKLPKAEGDIKDGRVTFSVVGGSIQQNFDRWVGQFKDLDENDDEALQKKNRTINGAKVQLLVLKGTFLDSAGGPFGPKTERDDYMLLGAALELGKDPNTGATQNVYIKAYGPRKTMEAHHAELKNMLEAMKVK